MATKKYLDYEGLQAFKAKCDEFYAINGALVFKGTVPTISQLPTVSGEHVGNMYNVVAAGTTTADFVEGAGKELKAGDNVVAVNVASTGSPAEMKWDILGGVFKLADKLTFGSSMPANPDNGDTFLYMGETSYTYTAVTPAGTENPSALGWYENVGGEWVLSSDETVDAQKTYYTRAEQYVKGVIYVYNASGSQWIPQTSGDIMIPITTAEVNNLFS